jgi:hypothetical protein
LAISFIGNIGSFHNLINFERLLAERIQNIFSIIQHEQTFCINEAKSLAVRQLIFCSYSHDIIHVALDAVSKTPIRLNRHSLNDGVNPWWINCGMPLGTLWPVTNAIIHFKAM